MQRERKDIIINYLLLQVLFITKYSLKTKQAIIFPAREMHLKYILKNGLLVETGEAYTRFLCCSDLQVWWADGAKFCLPGTRTTPVMLIQSIIVLPTQSINKTKYKVLDVVFKHLQIRYVLFFVTDLNVHKTIVVESRLKY